MSNSDAAAAVAAGGANTPWGWLGLLKWSLAYSDGTSMSESSPMSDEDKAFLEKVMKEGIIDENERMKEILQQVTEGLEQIRQRQQGGQQDDDAQEQDDEMEDLLQELRDIVEQIDYARAFAAMKGLDFLLGCIAQTEVPHSLRGNCLGILATLASNNPPTQKQLLEMGALKILMEVFSQSTTSSEQYGFRAKIVQAISAIVRSYDVSEKVFCELELSRQLILEGLQQHEDAAGADVLQKRTLFFLRALITSDDSNRQRVRLFAHSVAYTADHLVSHATNAEIREMAVALLVQILQQKHSVNTVLDRKGALAAKGVQQVAALRALTDQYEKEFASVELEHWETLLVLLARATPDEEEEDTTTTATTPLMIAGPNPEVEPQ